MLLPVAALPLVGVGVAQAAGGDPPGTIYVADESAGEIAVFAPGAHGNVAPERLIIGPDTGLSSPWGVAVSAAGDVFVSDFSNNTITEYAPQATGDATPICIIGGANTGLKAPQHLSLLPDGTLVVANQDDAAGDGGAITVYPPGACGDVTPIETIAGNTTTFSAPGGVGVDGTGALYVANTNSAPPAIDEFPAGASGNAAPQAMITGSNTGLGAVEDLDAGFDGKVYAVSAGESVGVTVYLPGSTGNATPTRDITGGTTGLSNPTGIAVTAVGGIFVTDADASVGGSFVGAAVLGFAAGDTGDVAPATAIYGSSSKLSVPEGVFVTGPQPSSSATLATNMTTPSSIPVSNTTSDSATLSGGTTAPTGSVIFRLYGPNDPTCSGKPASTSSSRQVSGDGTVSDKASPAQAGTYSWVVAYSGDASNAPITTACNQPSQTVEVGGVTSTSVSTSLRVNGEGGPSITVTAGTTVNDLATVTGTPGVAVTGTVTYNVYSDTACTQLVNSGAPQQITASGPPPSQGVTLTTPGTYYWQAVYSGDSQNAGSVSLCGTDGEVETVTPGTGTTTLTTTLTGSGGQSGTTVNVDPNTSVTDTATLTQSAGSATGTVTYTVFSDPSCMNVAVAGMAETITQPGTLPPSPPVKLAVGTYYWQASYSGDSNNAAATSTCGFDSETENVAPGTTVTTSLTGGGQSGPSITVGQGASVTDTATLSGSTASNPATGTVTYNVYSDSACTQLFNPGTPLTVNADGTVPPSAAVPFATPGTYYWQAVYSGDATHGGSSSNCGDEVLTVNEVPMTTTLTTNLDGDGQSGTGFSVPEGTTVTDQAALAGENVSSAGGTLTYNIYSDSACNNQVSTDTVNVAGSGGIPPSTGVTLSTPGTYYLTANYSGDDVGNLSSSTACGAETVIVTSTVQPKALILADSVTVPGPSPAPFAESLEQYEAEHDGYTVTTVTGAQWDAMTAAQFAQYQVIIIGDKTCSDESEFAAAVQNETTWEPVVMSSGGNKVLIGTDPVFHYTFGEAPNAFELLANGIAYAGNVGGATGAYIDLSCAYDASPASTPVPLLDGLSTHGAGQFTVVGEQTENACATAVNIVAQTGPTTGLTDADLSNWDCSVHEAFQTFPPDYTPLALAPSSSGFPDSYCADDVETGALACGSPYIMVSGSGVTVKSQISLTPGTQTQTEGGTANLTATVMSNGAPVVGGSVTFNVNSGPNVGATSSGTTNSSGQVLFSYNDSATGVGTDQVSATYTTDGGITEQATASVTWQPSAAKPTTVSTSLSQSNADNSGTSITVPAGAPVTDGAILTGANAAKATGSVTYNVYSDSACKTPVYSGPAQSIPTPGSLPASAAFTPATAGTYYWTASYSGDTNNQASASTCGSEILTVTAAPTSVSTQLSFDDSGGTQITVTAGTAVTDSAMLSGAVASSATGSVTYDVYSDSACTKPFYSGPAQSITTPGVLPSSAAVTMSTGGTYYWTASYSGDANDQKSVSPCGSETVTVTVTPTSVSTQLTAGNQTGTALTVTAGTVVTDAATLFGANAATATGTITYNVYSDNACNTRVNAGTAQPITAPGMPPPSAPVTLTKAGTYYWTASYSGDASNAPSVSPCGGEGGETVTVTAAPTTLTTSVSGAGQSGTTISVPAGSAVTDTATLTGAVASAATGTVTYSLYTSCDGGTLVGGGSPQLIKAPGVLPPSPAVTLRTAGTYDWAVSYSGDANNQPSVSSCGSEMVTVTAAPTTLATSLSGGGATPGPAITVPQGSAVTDSATLAGAVASSATGTVTYNVYSDSACKTPVNGGASTVTIGEGGIPSSAPVTLNTPGKYYWTASYPGDVNNQASASKCGLETVTVSPVAQPTTLTTSLSGGGKTGTAITVTAGTAITDSATLSGSNAAKATGTVIYNVYSDLACTKLVKGGAVQTITTSGTLPKSAAVTLTVAGTYYWQAAYSGDLNSNKASVSTCGGETTTVTAAATTLATSLSGGGHTGTSITVPAGMAVTDTATLSGAVASAAAGTVTFTVYSNSTCTTVAASAGSEVVTGGKSNPSAAVALTKAGTYYWTARYSGDASDLVSASTCGSEKLTVTPLPAIDTLTTAAGRSAATAKVTTTAAGDLLVALVAGRGPTAGGQTTTVSGGGVTWHFVGRENAGRGDVEVWTATAGGILNGVSVKATAKTGGFTVTMTVVAFKHAIGTGALAEATAATGTPKATIKTAHNDAWVFAMADDWAHAVTPKPATGQFVVSRVVDTTDTFWAQATSQLVVKAGTSVTISDSAPTKDPFDLIVVEVH